MHNATRLVVLAKCQTKCPPSRSRNQERLHLDKEPEIETLTSNDEKVIKVSMDQHNEDVKLAREKYYEALKKLTI